MLFVELSMMPAVMGMDEAFDPLGIGLLGANAVMFAVDDMAAMIQEAGFRGVSMVAGVI